MAKKRAKAPKVKKKLSPEALQEKRFLELAIANHETCLKVAVGEMKSYFEAWIAKNRAKLAELTGA